MASCETCVDGVLVLRQCGSCAVICAGELVEEGESGGGLGFPGIGELGLAPYPGPITGTVASVYFRVVYAVPDGLSIAW